MAYLGTLMVLIVGVMASVVIDGYVLSLLWAWLVVPTFRIPALSIAQAIGIMLVVGFIVEEHAVAGDGENPLERIIGRTIVRPAIVLAVGWIVTQWI